MNGKILLPSLISFLLEKNLELPGLWELPLVSDNVAIFPLNSLLTRGRISFDVARDVGPSERDSPDDFRTRRTHQQIFAIIYLVRPSFFAVFPAPWARVRGSQRR